MKAYHLSFVLLFCIGFFTNLNAQEDSDYGLLWKIESEKMTEPSYLFGTMHVQDERAFNFSDSVMINLERCEQFAMELHPDSMMAAIYDKMFDPDTTNYFKEYMSEEEYEMFLEKFSKDKGYNFEDIENKNPMTIKALTKRKSSYNSERGTFVDMHLCGVAKTYGKSIHGLENTDNQLLNLKESALQQVRMYLYMDSLDMKPYEEKLANTYSEGDMKEMEKMMGRRVLENPHFVKRNTDMVNNMIELMDKAPTFSAVGAAHLVGEKSVIALLEEKGYTVSVVEATFTGVADTYAIDPAMFPWQPFINEDAGVMLDFPAFTKYIKQSFEHPDDASLDSTDIHMWLCSDLTNMTNYLFAYNNYPSGYYIDNIQESFDAAIDELLLTSERLSPTITIYKNGVEGRQIDLNVRNTTYARLQLFIRGNRVYKFLVQNLNQGEKRIPENKFLSNVQFLPYKVSEPMLNSVGSELFDFMEFSDSVIEPDTAIDYSSFTENNVSYYSINPSTGGLYSVISEKMMKYYRAESRDSFFNFLANSLISWTDTIVHSEPVMSNDYQAIEYVAKSKEQSAYRRFRINLVGDQLIVHTAYADSIELWGPMADKFFDGVKLKKTVSDFDLVGSKAKLILSDILSEDTIAYQQAFGALDNYYYFTKEDMPDLLEAATYHYPRDTGNSGVVKALLTEIGLLEDSTQVEFLVDLYKNNEATSEAKCDLLYTVLTLGDTTEFLNLFFEDTPQELSRSYFLMSPFTDSLEIAIQYYDQLLPLLSNDSYRDEILSLSYTMLDGENSTLSAKEMIKKNYQKLIAHRTEDVEEYKEESQKEDAYFWPSKIQYYLYLSQHSPDANLESFLDEVITVDTSGTYITSLSVASRFANDLAVDQNILDTLLSLDYYVYDIVSYANKFDKIKTLPDSLQDKTTQVFYKAKSFLYEDDAEPVNFKFLGTTEVDKVQYYVYNFSDEYYYGDGDNNQILLVGGAGNKKSFSLEEAKSYYFEIGKEDTKRWKEKVKENISDFQKYAY